MVYWLLMHCFLQEMCVQYWPETVGQSEVYGTFQVEVCGNERVLGEYIVRKLKLSPVDMVSSFMSTVICCFISCTLPSAFIILLSSSSSLSSPSFSSSSCYLLSLSIFFLFLFLPSSFLSFHHSFFSSSSPLASGVQDNHSVPLHSLVRAEVSYCCC